MRIWRRRLAWGLFGLGLLGAVAHLVVRYPIPFFRYAVREQGVALRSDQPFDADCQALFRNDPIMGPSIPGVPPYRRLREERSQLLLPARY